MLKIVIPDRRENPVGSNQEPIGGGTGGLGI